MDCAGTGFIHSTAKQHVNAAMPAGDIPTSGVPHEAAPATSHAQASTTTRTETPLTDRGKAKNLTRRSIDSSALSTSLVASVASRSQATPSLLGPSSLPAGSASTCCPDPMDFGGLFWVRRTIPTHSPPRTWGVGYAYPGQLRTFPGKLA